ncbi:MAG: PEGA domain-containing protein [Deltaproteobacteria bacterium]|nr:PEGA domain-containing protein [Deltaproteobacteria bacterium]
MRGTGSVAAFGMLLLLLEPNAALASSADLVIAVFDPIDGDHVLTERDGAALGDHVAGLLGRVEGVSVVPRDSVRAFVTAEKAKSYEACFAEACQIELGKALAAQKSFTLRLSRLGDQCVVKADLIDLLKEASEWSGSLIKPCTAAEIVKAFETMVEDFRLARVGGVVSSRDPRPEERGTLRVVSEPADAPVFLDGRQVGRTPFEQNVAAKQYALALRLDGYDDAAEMIVVRPGRTALVEKALVRQTGTLIVSSKPAGATVELDGLTVGATPLQKPGLLAGKARVRLSLDGYEVAERDVLIRGNAPTTMSFSLQARMARISVLSNPDADVQLNDRSVGRTPVDLDVRPGDVRLRLTATGHEPSLQSIQVAPGEQRVVTVTLTESVLTEAQIAEQDAATTRTVIRWSCVGAAIVSAGVATFFGVRALNAKSDLRSQSPGDPETADRISSGKTAAIVADVSALAALGFGIGAIVSW